MKNLLFILAVFAAFFSLIVFAIGFVLYEYEYECAISIMARAVMYQFIASMFITAGGIAAVLELIKMRKFLKSLKQGDE